MVRPRLHGLFEKLPNGKYKQVKPNAYTKAIAIQVYQNDLLKGFFYPMDEGQVNYYCLRPVPKVTATKRQVNTNL